MATTKQKPAANLDNVISTIDVNLTAFVENSTENSTEIPPEISARERFLDDYNHCPLCGGELLFTHVTHFAQNVAHEEAHCEPCKVRTKSVDHTMQ